MSSDTDPTNANSINTAGKAVIDGTVNTGRDFVGRDQTIHGDQVSGDKILGDKVLGDKNIITEEVAYNVHGLTNPYLGLRAFGYADCAIYAGREQLAQETIQRLTAPGTQQTLLFITGSSGSGKSSFAQAGLIPLLESHYAAYQKTVRHAIFRPSSQPLVMLADALQKLHPDLTPETLTTNTPKDQINLLLIDQFEELFIQSDASQRAPFCDFLTNLPSSADCRIHILITLRVDYLDELFAIQPLWAIAKEGVELRAMSAEDLRNAIQKPLQVTHPQQRFAPELLDRLVQDASGEPTLLPLLQVTLAELWKTGKLLLSNYHSLTNAIRQRAELVYAFSDQASADPKTARPVQDQQALMSILLDLINVSVDGADRRDARQRRTRQELEQGSPQRPRLIEELVNARLLAAANETRNGADVEVIDIIHESLIDNWERLREAIEEQREQLQRRARFKLLLGDWLRNGREEGYLLLTDMQLAEARALVDGRDIEVLSGEAQAFYQLSLKQYEAERQREIAQQRQLAEEQRKRAAAEELRAKQAEEHVKIQTKISNRLRLAVKSIGMISILLLSAFSFAYYQTQRANQTNQNLRDALQESMARQLAASALSILDQPEPTGDLGLLLAREAVLATLQTEGYVTAQADTALRKAVGQASWQKTIPANYHRGFISAVDISSDGNKLISSGSDGSLILWNAETGQAIRSFYGYGYGDDIKFSQDDRLIASISGNTIRIWQTETGTIYQNFTMSVESASLTSIAFSPDGRLLAAYHKGQDSNHLITVWDILTSTLIEQLSIKGELIDFSSTSNAILIKMEKNIAIWNIVTNKVIDPFFDYPGADAIIELIYDTENPRSSFAEKIYLIWDTANGQGLQVKSKYEIDIIEYNAKAQIIVTENDGVIILWNATRACYALHEKR